MCAKLLELRPDRALLNPDFDGYKLSLEEIPTYKKKLDTQVNRVFPDANQYSILHARLFGLHNHLIGESLDGRDYVYFIDKDMTVHKASLDPFSSSISDLTEVWQIPTVNHDSSCYNTTLKFVAEDLAVASDGNGFLYVISTGSRNNDGPWNILHSEEILDSKKFVIKDGVCLQNDGSRELHLLLMSIVQNNPSERFYVVLYYVTLREAEDKLWGAVALRELIGKGDLHYGHFGPNCKALYLVSENNFEFIVDSENPVKKKESVDEDDERKTYRWSQTKEDLTVKFILAGDVDKNDVKVDAKDDEISVKHSDEVLLCGKLYQAVDSNLTTWTIENNCLEVVLSKKEVGLMWTEVVVGNNKGEFIVDSCVVEEAHEKLSRLCSENEVLSTQSGATFNSQQVEECDFEDDKNLTFERINVDSHEVTHKSNIGSNQILLTVQLSQDLPPAIALRNDVDACLWQPVENENDFCLKHEGTLFAFGYIQASKQQRKFTICSPNLNYSVICESSRHIFIYKQCKTVTSGELRNRTTGRRVGNVAQQQVVNLSNEEILGVHATNSTLFLLTESHIYALNVGA